jgi:hypothetical protein
MSETKPIYLIGCGASKLPHAAPARELYTGDLFKKALAYALSVAEESEVFVFSAKHGFLTLDQEIEPYNATWKRGPCLSTRELAAKIPDEWAGRDIVFLCGIDYRMCFLYAYGHKFGDKVSMKFLVPLEGKGIGQQKKWLKENTKTDVPND